MENSNMDNNIGNIGDKVTFLFLSYRQEKSLLLLIFILITFITIKWKKKKIDGHDKILSHLQYNMCGPQKVFPGYLKHIKYMSLLHIYTYIFLLLIVYY